MLFGYKSPQSTQYMHEFQFKARKFQTWPEGEVIPLVAGLSLMPQRRRVLLMFFGFGVGLRVRVRLLFNSCIRPFHYKRIAEFVQNHSPLKGTEP